MEQNSTNLVDIEDQIFSNELIINQIFSHLRHVDLKSISLTNRCLWRHGRRILRKRECLASTWRKKNRSVCTALKMLDDLLKASHDIPFQGIRFSSEDVNQTGTCGELCLASENPDLAELYPNVREAKYLLRNVKYILRDWTPDCPGLKFFQSLIVQNADVVETLTASCYPFSAHPHIPDRFKTMWDYLGIEPSLIQQQQSPPVFTNLKEYSDHSAFEYYTPLKALLDVAPNLRAIHPRKPLKPTWVVNSSGIPQNKFGALVSIKVRATEDLDNLKKADFQPGYLYLCCSFLETLSEVSSFKSFLQSNQARLISAQLTSIQGNFANIAFISVAVASRKVLPFQNLKHMQLNDYEELSENIQDTRIRFIKFDVAFPRLSQLSLTMNKPRSEMSPPLIPLVVNFEESKDQSTNLKTLDVHYNLYVLNAVHSIELENVARFFPNVQKLLMTASHGNRGPNWSSWSSCLLRISNDPEMNHNVERIRFSNLDCLMFSSATANELPALSIPDLFGFSEEYLNDFHDQEIKAIWQSLNIFPRHYSSIDPEKLQTLKISVGEYEELKLDGSTERCFIKTLDALKRFLPIPVVKLLSLKFTGFKLLLRCSSNRFTDLYEALQQHLQHYAQVEVVEKQATVTFFWGCQSL